MNGAPEHELALPRSPTSGWRAVASLGGIALLAALLIGLAWQNTRSRIADNEARRILTELTTVLPAALYDNAPYRDVVQLDAGSGRPLPVYRARRNGVPTAAVLTVEAPDGYVGPVRLLVGVDSSGRVLGVHITLHSETPGVGDAVAGGTPPWVGIFTGHTPTDPPEGQWQLRQDGGTFDAIAGATVSSRSVVGAVRRAVQYFAMHKDEIFAAPAEDRR